ncbi:hypothetical protein OsJ_31825 [Oryza sativa Japonica Group]|uniref:(S)-ureidoglycine aminohydrolase cupin domain-containing protein n=2 Tax=Oryza TaxID=4527 RepID=B9G655_ORYSJ|nr:hypothetical protein OsJ_31825 [Oryza sativa Japonica Group]
MAKCYAKNQRHQHHTHLFMPSAASPRHQPAGSRSTWLTKRHLQAAADMSSATAAAGGRCRHVEVRSTTAASRRKVCYYVLFPARDCNFSERPGESKPLHRPLSMASSSSPPPPCTVAAGGGIAVERSPPESRLSELGARWGGGPGRMALSYGARQTCYIVRGKVTATATAAASAAEGSPENGRRVEFGAGDIVVFPKGTRCTWHIAAAVDMHYAFDPS